MFRCSVCNQQSNPREKSVRVVVETREVIYPFRPNANTFVRSEKIGDKFVMGKKETSNDPGGVGRQVAKEILTCMPCAQSMETSNTE